MANYEGRIGSYHYNVEREEMMPMPRPGDILRFDVCVLKRCTNNISQGDIIGAPSTLLATSITDSCESFLEINQDFMSRFLSDPRCSRYFIPESIDQATQMVASVVQQLMDFPSEPEHADLERQEFYLTLEIFLDVAEDYEEDVGEVENATIIEESMQQDVSKMMIRASDEAIQSLETFNCSQLLMKNIEMCNICMENFNHADENEDDVKLLSSMPCDHVFHHQCIVKWLNTSHTCPLCRYPMPTVKD